MAQKSKKLNIDKQRCKGCLLCIEICPHGALGHSEKVNKKGHRYVILKYPKKCTKCTFCAVICPDCAIEVPGGNNED